jgi:hypothetical protein
LIWRERGGLQEREEEISYSPLEEAKVESLDNFMDAAPCKAIWQEVLISHNEINVQLTSRILRSNPER